LVFACTTLPDKDALQDVKYLLVTPGPDVFAELANMLAAKTSNADISKAVDGMAPQEVQCSADFLVNYVKTIVLSCLPANAKGE